MGKAHFMDFAKYILNLKHRLTLPKGVYSLRYFLPQCVYQIWWCIYSFCQILLFSAHECISAPNFDPFFSSKSCLVTVPQLSPCISIRLNEYTPFGSVSLWTIHPYNLFPACHVDCDGSGGTQTIGYCYGGPSTGNNNCAICDDYDKYPDGSNNCQGKAIVTVTRLLGIFT